MKRLDAKHTGIQFGVRIEQFPHRAAWNIAAARERDMRMPRAQIRFESDSQRCLLHAFVHLKQVRVTFPNADPNDFHRPFWGKRSDTFDRKKKCTKLDRAQ